MEFEAKLKEETLAYNALREKIAELEKESDQRLGRILLLQELVHGESEENGTNNE